MTVSSETTVVIPTRDRVALLEQTLRTVLAQEPRPEVVVVDDGSGDGTAARLASLPVTVVRNDGAAWGASRARNEGIKRAETPFVAFVDSDDLLLPGALGSLAAALREDGAAPFAYGCALAAAHTPAGWASEGVIAPERGTGGSLGALYARNAVPSSGALVRRSALDGLGGYDERLTFSEDHDLWLRLARTGAPVHVPELVVVHRRHGGNRHDQALALADEAAITRHADADPRLAPARPERLGMLLCEHALEAVKAGDPAELARAARRLWLPGPGRGRILRAAARHFLRRRRAGALGRRVWEERADVREWLRTVAP
jgi:hypothetical protein